MLNLFKSVFHNSGVVLVGLGAACIGKRLDSLLGLGSLRSGPATAAAWPLLGIGFGLRVWATFHFYERRMKVISLEPQTTLLTSGPYRFSRNPLYLGGNVFIFTGGALLLGSPTTLFATAAHLPLIDLFIRREERQLEKNFGEAWQRYKERVPRWV